MCLHMSNIPAAGVGLGNQAAVGGLASSIDPTVGGGSGQEGHTGTEGEGGLAPRGSKEDPSLSAMSSKQDMFAKSKSKSGHGATFANRLKDPMQRVKKCLSLETLLQTKQTPPVLPPYRSTLTLLVGVFSLLTIASELTSFLRHSQHPLWGLQALVNEVSGAPDDVRWRIVSV